MLRSRLISPNAVEANVMPCVPRTYIFPTPDGVYFFRIDIFHVEIYDLDVTPLDGESVICLTVFFITIPYIIYTKRVQFQNFKRVNVFEIVVKLRIVGIYQWVVGFSGMLFIDGILKFWNGINTPI